MFEFLMIMLIGALVPVWAVGYVVYHFFKGVVGLARRLREVAVAHFCAEGEG